MKIRDKYGAVVAHSQNLRGILDYTRRPGITIERADLFGPNKQGGGTLGVTWSDGATTLVDFADFDVMRDWVGTRAKGKRAIFPADSIKVASEATSSTDFDVADHGTLIMLEPISEAAKEWVAEHLPDDAQWLGRRVAIERRFFEPIYEGIVADGLSIS